jgi:hypothetical protein
MYDWLASVWEHIDQQKEPEIATLMSYMSQEIMVRQDPEYARGVREAERLAETLDIPDTELESKEQKPIAGAMGQLLDELSLSWAYLEHNESFPPGRLRVLKEAAVCARAALAGERILEIREVDQGCSGYVVFTFPEGTVSLDRMKVPRSVHGRYTIRRLAEAETEKRGVHVHPWQHPAARYDARYASCMICPGCGGIFLPDELQEPREHLVVCPYRENVEWLAPVPLPTPEGSDA